MADRWSTCPRCEARRVEDLAKRGAELSAACGKVTADEYEAMKRTFAAFSNARCSPETFREDYEIGLHNGEFTVDYHGKCEDCGLTHTFKINQLVGAPQ